jgi:general stress protein YciG
MGASFSFFDHPGDPSGRCVIFPRFPQQTSDNCGISPENPWHYSFSGYCKSLVMENNENQNRPNRDAKTSNRGLASADPKTRAEVARKGGEAVSRNREHMAAIGRKGGQTASQDRQHMSQIGRKGGEAVSRDRQHMSEIGRKGGENSRGNDAKSGEGSPENA